MEAVIVHGHLVQLRYVAQVSKYLPPQLPAVRGPRVLAFLGEPAKRIEAVLKRKHFAGVLPLYFNDRDVVRITTTPRIDRCCLSNARRAGKDRYTGLLMGHLHARHQAAGD